MNYILKTIRILLATAMMLSGCQGSSEKYMFRDAGIEQLNAGSYGETIQSFNSTLGKSDGLVRTFEVDVLEYRAEVECKAEDYAAATHVYKILNQVDRARPEYVGRQNILYIRAGELDKAMEVYQAAYGPGAGKSEADGKGGGGSTDNRGGKDGKKDADKENGTDGGDANNGTGNAGGGDTAAISDQVTVLLSLGQVLTEVERLDDTRTLYQQAIDDDIRSDEFYNRMGLCEMEAGDLDMALSYLGAGMQLPDEDARQKILYNRVTVYEQKQGFATALGLLETYAATYGSMPEVDRKITFLESHQQ